MPANALAIFESGQLPAHIATMNDDAANIVARVSGNSIVLDGGRWTINLDGKKTKLMRKNADDEEEPVAIVSVVVLDYVKERGREWYAKKYDPKNPSIPDCWSENGKVPHDNVPVKVSPTCAACPNSQKGSAQNQAGEAAVACGQFQKLAVIPAAGLKTGNYPPLRLRLKITSIYDKAGQDSHPNWFAWQQYLDLLTSKGVRSTGLLPTKMKADPNVSYAKILFSPGKDWLDEESLVIVKELMGSDTVKELLAATYDPSQSTTGNKPLPADTEEETEVAAAPQPAAARPAAAKPGKPVVVPPKPKPAPAPVDDEDDQGAMIEGTAVEEDGEEVVPTAEQKAAATRATAAKANTNAVNIAAGKAAAKAAAAKAAPVDDDDDDGTAVVAAPVKPVAPKPAAAGKPAAAATGGAKATPAKGAVEAPQDVADMLGSWDDE